ncbi:RNA-directed DNA polymerase, eukaryota, reverse transcriptase zinc-binding domain protein [Tanacetum coccineum]
MGDFNVTLKLEEHSAGGSKVNGEMLEFRECLNDIEVEDSKWSGLFYTWIKSPSMKQVFSKNLTYPAILHLPNSLDKKRKSFKFSNFVADKEEFISTVSNEWKNECEGYSMFKLVKKMKRMKIPMNNLAWKNGNIFQNVKNLLKRSQEEVEANPYCKKAKENLSKIFQEYNVVVEDEEKLLAQKAKIKWPNNVAMQFVKHFKSFLGDNKSTEQIKNPEELFSNKLTANEAEEMIKDVTNEEIKEAMFGIGNDKAPGPDGFTAVFFKKSWNIVGSDVCEAIKEFFRSNKLLGEVNATLITLVPKIQHPSKVSDYRRRLIEDNLLITQELLKGYNRKNGPQRCALKIDIAKVLPSQLMLMAKGMDFKSGRGLRQGDPMSPYLFYIGYGSPYPDGLEKNHHSVEVLKQGLMEFSGTLGLIPNMNKSTIFFGSVKEIEKQRILEIMPFAVGKLPMKYLGVPLITKNIGIAECNQLVDRVKQTVSDWKNKALSYAGRLQLIASVLASMHIYWASVFLIPCCRGCAECTLVWRYYDYHNETLLCKHLWNLITKKESLWVKWVYIVRLKEKSIWNVEIDENDSGTWKAILNLREKVRNNVWKEIEDGKDTSVWFDKWCHDTPLGEKITFKDRYEARLSKGLKVAEMINNKVWKWPSEWNTKFSWIKDMRTPNLEEGKNDCNVWMDDNGNRRKFSIRKVWDIFKENKPEISWHKAVWFSQCNPRHAFILWLAMHGRLATQDRIMAWNKQKDLLCPLCNKVNDSHEHLLFRCQYSTEIWESLTDKMGIQKWDIDWRKMMDEITINCRNSIQSVLNGMIMAAAVYYIWTERNKRIFTDEKRNSQSLLEGMMDSIKMQLMGIKVKNSPAIKKISEEWNIKMNCRE